MGPVAGSVTQAQIVAVNAVGGDRTYADTTPNMILKGVGLDVISFGRIEPDAGDLVLPRKSSLNVDRRL